MIVRKPLTNAERQARWREKRDALIQKVRLQEARKPWKLHRKARKGDADGYIREALDWWTAYEYRVRKEIELSPSTFSDEEDRDEMVRALNQVGEEIVRLAQKVGGR